MSCPLDCFNRPRGVHSLCFFLALIGVTFGVSLPAQAKLIFWATLSRFPDPDAGPFAFKTDTSLNSPPSDGWVSLVLSASTSVSTISSIEARISGQLHQRWEIDSSSSETIDTPVRASRVDGDSHLLGPPIALAHYLHWFEDNNVTFANPHAVAASDTETRDYGIGSRLEGAWFIPQSTPTTAIDFGYIVIPRVNTFGPSTVVKMVINLTNGDSEARDLYVCGGSGDVAIGLCNYDPAEITVSGKERPISDDDATPSLLDGTDFGVAAVGSEQVRTFKIGNFGIAPLELSGLAISGPFSIVGDFPQTINGHLNQIFKVALDTSVPGTYQGSISFRSNDANESPFNFLLSARVVPEPSTLLLAMVCWALIPIRRR